jgi:hypothetical protein
MSFLSAKNESNAGSRSRKTGIEKTATTIYFLVVLEFELMASHLLGRWSTYYLSHVPSPILLYLVFG